MSETQAGPYDALKCAFCGRTAKNGLIRTAAYSRREKYAQTGPWLDACQVCVKVPYDQPKQFSEAT